MDSLGSRLKQARKTRGLTQAQVTELLSLGANVLSEIERDVGGVSDRRLEQLAELYARDVNELAGRVVRAPRDEEYFDGILHAVAAFNRTIGELVGEVQSWRSTQREARRQELNPGHRNADERAEVTRTASGTTAIREAARRKTKRLG